MRRLKRRAPHVRARVAWLRPGILGAALTALVGAGSTLALAQLPQSAAPNPAHHGAKARAAAVSAGAAASRGPRCTPAHLNASALLPGTPLAVSPLPGSRVASPHTQISFLGVPASALRRLRVRGSRTGGHAGRLAAYSQGDGASFLPKAPFASGEGVTVSGTVARGGRRVGFTFGFVVAHEDPIKAVRGTKRIRLPNQKQHYLSEPSLEPPALVVTARSSQTAPGYVFAAVNNGPGLNGPLIFDDSGAVVWFHPLPNGFEGADLKVQQLFGKPVLTWWQGLIPHQGFGEGENVIVDSSYRQVGRVHAGNGYKADLHEFKITPQGSALLTAFAPVACDLSAYGGPRSSAATDTLFQEVDLRTGLVKREWHSLDHVAISETYVSARDASREWPLDYFHLNSIDQIGPRTILSARNTWGVYEINTRTGQVLLRLGGRRPNVKPGHGTATAYQHDAERQADGSISIFDNGAVPQVHRQSRGIRVAVDTHSKAERVVAQYTHPRKLLAGSQGNMQVLPGGDVFIGWGSAPYFSEFSASGQLLFDAHMHGAYLSYRGYRFAWTGMPSAPPAIALSGAAGAPRAAHVSWNGDTRTASWRLLAGASPSELFPVAEAARAGFETALQAPAPAAYLAAQALDASGTVLATSPAVRG